MSEFFDELTESLEQAIAIRKGEMSASREFTLERPNIKAIREKTGLSQTQFAKRLHISPRTLQNWEQGHRYPTGPAIALIHIIDKNPNVLMA